MCDISACTARIMVVVLCVCVFVCLFISHGRYIAILATFAQHQLKIYYLAESAILFYNFESRVCSSVLSFVPDMLTGTLFCMGFYILILYFSRLDIKAMCMAIKEPN